MLTLSWVFTAKGWLMSKDWHQHYKVLLAILHVAWSALNLGNCIGARLGRGVAALSPLARIDE